MPRVHTLKTVRRPKGAPPHTCDRCHKPIEPGQNRYEWSFRYGGTYRRHTTCGYPRSSELTQSNKADLYAAQEAVEDALQNQPQSIDDYPSWAEGVAQALSDAAEVARDTGSIYEQAAEPFGNQGENQERYEACEAWADELDNAAPDVEAIEPDLPERDDFEDDDDGQDEYDQAVISAVEDACSEVENIATQAIGALEL
jgi:hypothetical protein